MKQSWPYLIFVIALFLGINAPSLFSEGMFMDGLFYSTISRNLAEGKGTFWDLYYTETYNYHFVGHPPLAMGIQSWFYRLFGDYIVVEHIYSLFVFVISNLLIVKIWLLIVSDELKKLYWFPLLLHVIVGVVGWSVSNNMLENTMTVFVLLAFYLALLSLRIERVFFKFSVIVSSGVVLFLAFLTKGVVAIFPLSSLFFIGLFSAQLSFKKGLGYSFLMLVGLLIPAGYLYLFVPEAIVSLTNYYEAQLVHSLTKVDIISSRFWIIWSLIQQLIPVLLLAFLILIVARKGVGKLKPTGTFWYLIAIGFSGVLPMLISLKQRDFYIVSAYPFFVLAIALLVAPFLMSLLSKLETNTKTEKTVKIVSVLLLCVSLTITVAQKGRIGRDKEMITAIKSISQVLPRGSIIAIPIELNNDWSLRGYFARYHSVGLTFELEAANYYLSDKDTTLQGFEKVTINSSSYQLFRLVEE